MIIRQHGDEVQIKNCTNRPIHLLAGGRRITTFEPCGTLPFVMEREKEMTHVLSIGSRPIPITEESYRGVVNLPDKEEGTLYIVDPLVMKYVPRKDFIAPDQEVTDDEGNISGYLGFRRIARD